MLENLAWLGHDSFRVADPESGRNIYFDPFKLTSYELKADLILISHDHFDHYSPDDVFSLLKPGTVVVTVDAVAKQIAKQSRPPETVVVKPGDRVTAAGYQVEAVPAYNTNKYRAPGQHFHPKAAGHVGFVVTVGGKRIYHTGDSDPIPEMAGIRADIALIPVSGTYVMTCDEAVEAAGQIRASVAVPMHYGAIVGDEADARRFADECRRRGLGVEILPKVD